MCSTKQKEEVNRMFVQEKALRICDYISNNLFFSSPDLNIGKNKFNSQLLLSLLTSINKGKQLSVGEPGDGKTTVAEYLLGFIYGIPQKVMVSSSIKGSDELTIEKIIGRLNFGELNKGNEKVHWSLFVALEPKIFDEFNKTRPDKQNLVLEGLDRGNFGYLNEMIPTGDYSLFANSNPNDPGGYPLNQAVKNRFAIQVPFDQPNGNDYRLIRHHMIGKRRKLNEYILNDSKIENEMYAVLKSDEPYEHKIQKMQVLQDQFKRIIEEKTGLELITSQELEQARESISNIKISPEADMLYDVLRAELTSCMKFGKKRVNEKCYSGCHYKDFMCGKKTNSDSARNQRAEIAYSQALAWLLGDTEIEVKHIKTLEPYFLWHQIDFTPEYVKKFEEDERTEPILLYVAKQATSEMVDRFLGIKGEQCDAINLLKKNQIDEVKQIAKKVGHPVIYDYLKMKA